MDKTGSHFARFGLANPAGAGKWGGRFVLISNYLC